MTAAVRRMRARLAKFRPEVLEEAMGLYRRHGHEPGWVESFRAELSEALVECGGRASDGDLMVDAFLELARS